MNSLTFVVARVHPPLVSKCTAKQRTVMDSTWVESVSGRSSSCLTSVVLGRWQLLTLTGMWARVARRDKAMEVAAELEKVQAEVRQEHVQLDLSDESAYEVGDNNKSKIDKEYI